MDKVHAELDKLFYKTIILLRRENVNIDLVLFYKKMRISRRIQTGTHTTTQQGNQTRQGQREPEPAIFGVNRKHTLSN